MRTSEEYSPPEIPPNITACCSSIRDREKIVQGGGRDPFTEGDDQVPDKHCNHYITSHANSSNDNYNLSRVHLPSEVPIGVRVQLKRLNFMLCWHSLTL